MTSRSRHHDGLFRFLFEGNPWKFHILFLSALYGIILFKIFLSFYLYVGRVKNDDFNLYMLGWMLFPAFGLASGGFFEALRRRWFSGNFLFYPFFIFINFAIL